MSAPHSTEHPSVEALADQKQSQRGFWSLIVTQFQGAFSDNALKNLVVFLLVAGVHARVKDPLAAQAESHRIGELVGALFAIPFIVFSMYGGFLADRFSKRTITIGVKIFEVFVMLLATAGFALNSMTLLLTAVFLMGTHSAFFGPSKYGLMPELLPEKRLSWGNGILELGTFSAVILGTVAGALLAEHLRGRHFWSGVILVTLAGIGLATSLGITRVPPANPQKKFQPNFLSELFHQFGHIRRDRPLFLAVIGNTYFNFLGALLILNIFFYGLDVLHVTETRIGLLNTALALGIGLGSFAAGHLSGGKIETGLIPLGTLGLAVCASLLSVANLTLGEAAFRLALLGFAGGFFIVPICALLQHKPDKERKGAVLATANLLSFVGVFLASGAHFVLTQAHVSPGNIFLVGGLLTLAGALYSLWLLPDAFVRFLLWTLTHTLYRIRVVGRDNIPEKGGALFVCNHLSLVDALLLQASTDRSVRFIMFKGIYDRPLIKPFAKVMGVIPISSQLRPREMIKSLQTASEAIRAGEVVCIFAEGQITRIGQMLPFRRGFERIMKGVDAPIIPVCLDGVWGSIFSFAEGRFYWKLPRRLPYPVTVNYGKPLPPTATPLEVRQVVQELQSDSWELRREEMLPLHRSFVETARRYPSRQAMSDVSTPKLTFISALGRTVFLARRLRRIWEGQDRVGLLLPPSVPGALVNHAAMLSGRVPVNLNYTLSAEALTSCIEQAGIRTVVTSKAFLEKVKLKVSCETVVLEDIAANPGAGEKLSALVAAWLCPPALLERSLGFKRKPSLDDLATIIFSSGSTGEPKGVMLSHYNIASNVAQMGQVFGFEDRDRVLGILPFFHSFGFTAALALPTALGVGVVYHPNPLDGKVIGQLVQDHGVTFLLATPTFLQFYLRSCEPEDFGSLRLVMAGAEKLPERLAMAFEEHFGIRPVEGYGCTECSPAVTVSTHDFRAAGFRQVGAKRGKIGHPLPGMSVRIVDPDTRQPLPVGQAGLLLVRGPNVMRGYLGQPEKTTEVLRDGWYVTGDIATLDEDGFVQITDRLSRFSKIGGEMVPHIKVEEKLHELAGVTEQTFAVTGVPDEKKGERLVVLHTLTDGKLKECLEKFVQADLPNLWKPRAEQFFRVEKLPFLGTGKLDLRTVRQLAEVSSAKSVAGRSIPAETVNP
jgi:acyl-[acyl-carrier-protein]-phospholipid O-acyltransferase/long-chain-fatty-acid--[acyl-carrier-protein] ligase